MKAKALEDRRPLSSYLEEMVQKTLLSEAIAREFNQLSPEELQQKAVERYFDERHVLARMIVSDFTRRGIPLEVADLESESTAHIQNRIDEPQIEPLSWQEIRDEGIDSLRAAEPVLRWIRQQGFWIAVVLCTAWLLSPSPLRPPIPDEVGQRLAEIPAAFTAASPASAVLQTPVVRPAEQRPVLKKPQAARVPLTEEPLRVTPFFKNQPPPTPTQLVLELVHGKSAVLRWNAYPGSYRYNLYWATTEQPLQFQKDKLSPLDRPSAIWPFPDTQHSYLIRVTSLDLEGRESVPSSLLRIDLSPAF